jgi:hypothetical protein
MYIFTSLETYLPNSQYHLNLPNAIHAKQHVLRDPIRNVQ